MPYEKECYEACKIKHAKVRQCQEVNFPTRLCMCIMIQSLITQLHTVFPQNFCFPLCTGCPRLFAWEAIWYFVFSLLFVTRLFRPCNEVGITDGLMALFSCLSSPYCKWPVFHEHSLQWPDLILDAVLALFTNWECKNIECLPQTSSFSKCF